MFKYILLSFTFALPITTFAADSSFTKKAQSEIKGFMKDPDSTQFKDLREIKNTMNQTSLCGDLNSKNSYGGYVGFKKFSYTNGELTILDPTLRNQEFNANKAQYDQSGCAGPEAEAQVRKEMAVDGYCRSVFQFYSDVIKNKITQDKALEIVKLSYDENNFKLIKPSFSDFEATLKQGLASIEGNKKLKNEIIQNNYVYRIDFIRQCKSALQ